MQGQFLAVVLLRLKNTMPMYCCSISSSPAVMAVTGLGMVMETLIQQDNDAHSLLRQRTSPVPLRTISHPKEPASFVQFVVLVQGS